MVETRALTPDDWPLWRALRLAALTEAPHAFGARLADWQGEGDDETRWRARLSIPGARDFVATLEGVPVGMASGVPSEEEGVAELISMWVSPTARGKGVADHLVTAVEHWATESAAKRLRLAVFPANTHALSLYRRHGFTPTGDEGTELLLEKPLRKKHR